MYFTFLVNIKIWCKIQVIIFPLFALTKGKNKQELQSEALLYHKIGPDYYNIGGFIRAITYNIHIKTLSMAPKNKI